jgi:threonine aldolase
MNRYSFNSDYREGAHPDILNALIRTNLNQEEGYGYDTYSKEAISLIKNVIQSPNADIHFVSGGTQANLSVISSVLKPYESVIAATTGHIAVHEAGAIETTGHKINTIEAKDGKLTPKSIKSIIDIHQDEHMVKPRLVFISNSTEIGTVYKKYELESLSVFCKQNNLFLYLDGARLASALTSDTNDISLPELSKLVDIFYIGGTKNGALFGEAIVINNNALKENFRFILKQKGALLAKGRMLGVQFLEFFKDNLFFELGKHSNVMAKKLSDGIKSAGYEFMTTPVSNQIFPILPNKVIDKLQRKYGFYIWKDYNKNDSVVRLVTSWATKEKNINKFLIDLKTD